MSAQHRKEIDDPWVTAGMVVHFLGTLAGMSLSLVLLLNARTAPPLEYFLVSVLALLVIPVAFWMSAMLRKAVSAGVPEERRGSSPDFFGGVTELPSSPNPSQSLHHLR